MLHMLKNNYEFNTYLIDNTYNIINNSYDINISSNYANIVLTILLLCPHVYSNEINKQKLLKIVNSFRR